MREMEVFGVRVQVPDNQPVVLLRELGGSRYLPIWVGAPEASAIALAQQGMEPPRPMTHDLLCNVVAALDRELEQVRIVQMLDNVFHAELHITGSEPVSARSSDAIALALRVSCPIFVAEEVLEAGGVPVEDEDPEENEVEAFREFLDQVSAEDFGAPGEGEEGQ